MSATTPPSGPAGSTRQSAQSQSQTHGQEDDLESNTMALQIRQLQQEITRLSRELSLSVDQTIPTTESHPNMTQQSLAASRLRFQSELPQPTRVKLSERTPDIECLNDGKQPTFRQWQASIVDRLEINADHYRSERARMALGWGYTTGLAKDYLEPRYLSEVQSTQFQDAEEMISLLKSYFIAGHEDAESRLVFHDLRMEEEELFPAFKARFISAAIKGSVSSSEWSFYLWEKITPSLRTPNLGFKRACGNSFDLMVEHLTAFDMERRHLEFELQE